MPTDPTAAPPAPTLQRTEEEKPPRRRKSTCRRVANTLGGLFILALLLYAFEFARFNFTEPTIARDYAAEHDFEAEKIPEEDRAWALYREAILKLNPQSVGAARALARLPEEYDHPDVVAYLEDNHELLELFRKAASRPVVGIPWTRPIDEELSKALGVPMTPTKGILQSRLPIKHLGAIQAGARLLSADARLAVDQGHGTRVVRDISAQLGMATQKWLRPRVPEALYAVSSFAGAARLVSEALYKRPDIFSDNELAALTDSLDAVEFDFQPILETERIFFLDTMQRVFSDDGAGDGLLIAAEGEVSRLTAREPSGLGVWLNRFFGPIRRHLIASRREHVELYEELLAQVKEQASLPLSEQLRIDRDPVIARLERLAFEGKHPFVLASFPLGLHVLKFEGRLDTERDAIIAVIALERYKREYGAYPAALTELVPEFLDEIPIDRFDGEPLRYALGERRPFLYSVGTDQDDDGGVPARDRSGELAPHPQSHPTDGDWVLFPPDWILFPESTR